MNRLDKPVKPLLASLPALANTFRSNDWAFKYVVLKINIKIDINKIFIYDNYTFFYENIKIIIHESIATLSFKNTNYFY